MGGTAVALERTHKLLLTRPHRLSYEGTDPPTRLDALFLPVCDVPTEAVAPLLPPASSIPAHPLLLHHMLPIFSHHFVRVISKTRCLIVVSESDPNRNNADKKSNATLTYRNIFVHNIDSQKHFILEALDAYMAYMT